MYLVLLLVTVLSSPRSAWATSNVTVPENIRMADICLLNGFRLTCLDRESNIIVKEVELFNGEARKDPSGIKLLRAMQMLKEEGLDLSSSHWLHSEPVAYFFNRPRAGR